MLRKLKGLLGFCQWNGCWNRSVYEVTAKTTKHKSLICKNCAHKLLTDKNTKFKNVTLNVDIDL